MATNNATNTSNPVSVSQGGTSNVNFTSYAVIAGGTTSTGNIQSIASVGNSGQALTSNGAGNLPTFQNITSGSSYALTFLGTTSGNPADSHTYFMQSNATFITSSASGNNLQQLSVVNNSTIKACTCIFRVASTLGSSENGTLIIRVNNTTDITVSSSVQLTSLKI